MLLFRNVNDKFDFFCNTFVVILKDGNNGEKIALKKVVLRVEYTPKSGSI